MHSEPAPSSFTSQLLEAERRITLLLHTENISAEASINSGELSIPRAELIQKFGIVKEHARRLQHSSARKCQASVLPSCEPDASSSRLHHSITDPNSSQIV